MSREHSVPDWDIEKNYLLRHLFNIHARPSPILEESTAPNDSTASHRATEASHYETSAVDDASDRSNTNETDPAVSHTTLSSPKTPESPDSWKTADSGSSLPSLIIEVIPKVNKHDDPPEFYSWLERKVLSFYRRIVIDDQSDISDFSDSDMTLTDPINPANDYYDGNRKMSNNHSDSNDKVLNIDTDVENDYTNDEIIKSLDLKEMALPNINDYNKSLFMEDIEMENEASLANIEQDNSENCEMDTITNKDTNCEIYESIDSYNSIVEPRKQLLQTIYEETESDSSIICRNNTTTSKVEDIDVNRSDLTIVDKAIENYEVVETDKENVRAQNEKEIAMIVFNNKRRSSTSKKTIEKTPTDANASKDSTTDKSFNVDDYTIIVYSEDGTALSFDKDNMEKPLVLKKIIFIDTNDAENNDNDVVIIDTAAAVSEVNKEIEHGPGKIANAEDDLVKLKVEQLTDESLNLKNIDDRIDDEILSPASSSEELSHYTEICHAEIHAEPESRKKTKNGGESFEPADVTANSEVDQTNLTQSGNLEESIILQSRNDRDDIEAMRFGRKYKSAGSHLGVDDTSHHMETVKPAGSKTLSREPSLSFTIRNSPNFDFDAAIAELQSPRSLQSPRLSLDSSGSDIDSISSRSSKSSNFSDYVTRRCLKRKSSLAPSVTSSKKDKFVDVGVQSNIGGDLQADVTSTQLCIEKVGISQKFGMAVQKHNVGTQTYDQSISLPTITHDLAVDTPPRYVSEYFPGNTGFVMLPANLTGVNQDSSTFTVHPHTQHNFSGNDINFNRSHSREHHSGSPTGHSPPGSSFFRETGQKGLNLLLELKLDLRVNL